MMVKHYRMVIEWSEIDDAYVVSFPEFPGAHTHGATYLEAARQGQTVLGRLIDACEREGQRLPAPVYYAPVTASP
jgi:predicted RNase H-like HicB family nuclease